jgi:hypothetical protein
VRRRTGIALLAKGLGVREVARLVGTSPGSVTRWRQTYERAGKEGLKAKRHPGAKPRLSVEDRQRLAAMLLEGAQAHGYSTDLRTLKPSPAGFSPAGDSSPPSAAGAFDRVAAPPAGLWNAAGWLVLCRYTQA